MPARPRSRQSANGPPLSTQPFSNGELAHHLLTVAHTLSVKGENSFKIRAYRRAAKTLDNLSVSLDEQIRAGADITQHPGIGKSIASTLRETVAKGRLGQMELMMPALPSPSKGQANDRRSAARRAKRADLKPGRSPTETSQRRLPTDVGMNQRGRSDRELLGKAGTHHEKILLCDADPLAADLRDFLRQKCGATRVQVVGAYRRRVETIDELRFLVVTDDFPRLLGKLAHYAGRIEPLETSSTSGRFRLPVGIGLIVEQVENSKWGLAEILRTGSTAFLEKLDRRVAGRQKSALPTSAESENTVFRALRLQPIPPELREGHDEINLAVKHRLPEVIELDDLRGDLHVHTTGSDGEHSIAEMARRAREKCYEYLGISDHSRSLKIARGMSEEALWRQIRAIDRLNEQGVGLRLFKSAEVDILPDGSLDYPNEILAELDYTVCSIHSRFNLGKEAQTERILRAMENPYFGILGHATGRRLLKRAGYEIDLERIIGHAKALGRAFEINAIPERLDLSAESARKVAEAGVIITINTDAHHIDEFERMRYGVDVARRAGLIPAQVLNTQPLEQMLRSLKQLRT